ncbi:MAG TPA: hypothetical protein VFM46_13395, partial [Pseudomonadales bacterium]|nr:hypothetical protein [Pseudomonadales bacterium]
MLSPDSSAQTPAQLITILSKSGIRLFVENGELKFKAPKGTLTDGLKQQVRHFKGELIALLSSQSAESISIPRVERTAKGSLISPNQRRLWLLEQLNATISAY